MNYFNTQFSLLRRAVSMAASRIIDLSNSLHAEGAEVYLIGMAGAWVLPLTINPNFLWASSNIIALASDIPRPVLLSTSLLLLLWHAAGVIFGGKPSAFIHTSLDEKRWLKFRRLGMYVAMLCWGVVGLLLSRYGVTTGTITYGVMGVGATIWGAGRLSVRIFECKEARNLREMRSKVDSGEVLTAYALIRTELP